MAVTSGQCLFGEWKARDSHAGILETSLMMAARPELVARAAVDSLEPTPVGFDRFTRSWRCPAGLAR
jgi:creatinine amidohydrolase/Fe(II)-dependent formamide hydrolase-like protein